MSTPSPTLSSDTPIDGTCSRALSGVVSRSTSTDHLSCGMSASASSTPSGVSKPRGRTNVASSNPASRTLSSLKIRIPSRRWS
jgi:hypothetical protein